MEPLDLTGLSVVIVEDEPLLGRQLVAHLTRQGADVSLAETLASGRRLLADLGADFVLLDVNLPDGSGIELLKGNIAQANTGVIVMTADGGVAGAVEAMRLGALDYLVKPFDPAEVPLVIARVRKSKQSARIEEHRRNEGGSSGDGFFFGSALEPVESQLKKIVAADDRMQRHLPPVLIHGETGTGKTTVARWLHQHGPRARQPMVEMNCSAVPDALAESEIFGHERGAFTDARTARIGLMEAAHGGTLFLDELPSLSLGSQAKLLKVLEDHRIRRLGGNKEIPVDVRVVAAAHGDLRELVARGQFREDLYHRLDLYRIQLPPLRDRGADLMRLASLLTERICKRHRLARKPISEQGRVRLMKHRWPGNVRELAHELERAIVFEEDGELNFSHLQGSSEAMGLEADPADPSWLRAGFRFPAQGFNLEQAINHLIEQALKQTDNNVSAAARMLGVSRDYVRYRLGSRKS